MNDKTDKPKFDFNLTDEEILAMDIQVDEATAKAEMERRTRELNFEESYALDINMSKISESEIKIKLHEENKRRAEFLRRSSRVKLNTPRDQKLSHYCSNVEKYREEFNKGIKIEAYETIGKTQEEVEAFISELEKRRADLIDAYRSTGSIDDDMKHFFKKMIPEHQIACTIRPAMTSEFEYCDLPFDEEVLRRQRDFQKVKSKTTYDDGLDIPIQSLLLQGGLVLIVTTDETHQVGKCLESLNAEFPFLDDLNLEDNIQLAISGSLPFEYPKTPSDIYDRVSSIIISSCFKVNSVLTKGCSDLSIKIRDIKYTIDFSNGDSPRNSDITIDRLSYFSHLHPILMRMKQALLATIDPSSWIEDLNHRILNHHRQKPLYNGDIYSLFINKVDPLGRSIWQHSSAAVESFKRIVDEMGVEREDKFNAEAMIKRVKIFSRSMESNISPYDNKYYCFPKHDLQEIESIRSASETSTKGSFVLKGDIIDYVPDEELIAENADGGSREHFFEKVNCVRMHSKAHMSLNSYTTDRNSICLSRSKLMLTLANKWKSLDMAYDFVMGSRLIAHSELCYDGEEDIIYFQPKDENKDVRILSSEPVDYPLEANHWEYSQSVSIDPDHSNLIEQCDISDLSKRSVIEYLSHSRDYQECRFKSKIATALEIARKPNAMIKVKHFKYSNVHAECLIKGLLFEQDAGMAYVSYFHNDSLYRTEKWRLVDLEQNTVGHHRIVSIILSMEVKRVRSDSKDSMRRLISRLSRENSWSISKFLKAYRYMATGYLEQSPLLAQTMNKAIGELDETTASKMSIRYIKDLLAFPHKPGSTPMFGLSFQDLGWEVFLVNVCPHNTYGRRKHLADTMKDLIDEMNLHDRNFINIESVYDDFKSIITNDQTDLNESYYNHFKKILSLSKLTDGRFTYSPASTLLIIDELERLNIQPTDKTDVQDLSRLMTARASYDQYTGEATVAAVSMANLANVNKSSSIPLLCWIILTSKDLPDMSMRMFDKAQVGGNREISILSSEFRVLQATSESFFKMVNAKLDNEYLDNSRKKSDFFNIVEDASCSKSPFFATIDQTRWGPNFNTNTFGLISAYLVDKHPEALLATAVCALGEGKLFEIPSWIPKLYGSVNSAFTLMGIVGRSHMAQGIYHRASSCYHALIVKFLQTCLRDKLEEHLIPEIQYVQKSMVTSDDCSIIEYFNIISEAEFKRINELKGDPKAIRQLDVADEKVKIMSEERKTFYMKYPSYICLFGIKTSDHKNIYSQTNVEFNSMYAGVNGIGSCEIKFCSSLIDPGTTGSFLSDYNSVLAQYQSSVNAGCDMEVASVITRLNYLKMCRQWSIRADLTGFPSEETMIRGSVPICETLSVQAHASKLLSTDSSLRFKKRELSKMLVRNLGSDVLSNLIFKNLDSLDQTKDIQLHRSTITHFKGSPRLILDSDYYSMMKALGETYTSFLRNQNMEPRHLSKILNPEFQQEYHVMPRRRMSPGKKFDRLFLRRTIRDKISKSSLLSISTPELFTLMPGYNYEDLMNHWVTMHVDKISDHVEEFSWLSELELFEKMTAISIIMEEIAIKGGSCTSYVFNPSRKRIKYKEYSVALPIKSRSIAKVVKFVKSSVPLNPNFKYHSSAEFSLLKVYMNIDFEVFSVVSMGPNLYMPGTLTKVDWLIPEMEEIVQGILPSVSEINEILKKGMRNVEVYLNLMVDESLVDKIEEMDNIEYEIRHRRKMKRRSEEDRESLQPRLKMLRLQSEKNQDDQQADDGPEPGEIVDVNLPLPGNEVVMDGSDDESMKMALEEMRNRFNTADLEDELEGIMEGIGRVGEDVTGLMGDFEAIDEFDEDERREIVGDVLKSLSRTDKTTAVYVSCRLTTDFIVYSEKIGMHIFPLLTIANGLVREGVLMLDRQTSRLHEIFRSLERPGGYTVDKDFTKKFEMTTALIKQMILAERGRHMHSWKSLLKQATSEDYTEQSIVSNYMSSLFDFRSSSIDHRRKGLLISRATMSKLIDNFAFDVVDKL